MIKNRCNTIERLIMLCILENCKNYEEAKKVLIKFKKYLQQERFNEFIKDFRQIEWNNK